MPSFAEAVGCTDPPSPRPSIVDAALQQVGGSAQLQLDGIPHPERAGLIDRFVRNLRGLSTEEGARVERSLLLGLKCRPPTPWTSELESSVSLIQLRSHLKHVLLGARARLVRPVAAPVAHRRRRALAPGLRRGVACRSRPTSRTSTASSRERSLLTPGAAPDLSHGADAREPAHPRPGRQERRPRRDPRAHQPRCLKGPPDDHPPRRLRHAAQRAVANPEAARGLPRRATARSTPASCTSRSISPRMHAELPAFDEWDIEAKFEMAYGEGKLDEVAAKRWDTLVRYTRSAPRLRHPRRQHARCGTSACRGCSSGGSTPWCRAGSPSSSPTASSRACSRAGAP